MKLQNPVRFNFTYAIDGGAWLEFANGERNWFSWSVIRYNFGQAWIDAQLKKQGWMTGCWVDCDSPKPAAFSHPVKRPFPRVTWKHDGQDECGELIGASPDNAIGLALTSRGFIRRLPLAQFQPA